jgi:hypothetical protein
MTGLRPGQLTELAARVAAAIGDVVRPGGSPAVIGLYLVAAGAEVVDLGDRVMGAPPGPEPVRARQEICLKDGLQDQLERRLDDPVPDARDGRFILPLLIGADLCWSGPPWRAR